MGVDSNEMGGGGVSGGGGVKVPVTDFGSAVAGLGMGVGAGDGDGEGAGRGVKDGAGVEGACIAASAWAERAGGGCGGVGRRGRTRAGSMEGALGESGLEAKSGEAGPSADDGPGLGTSGEWRGRVRIRGPNGAREGRSCAEGALLAGCGAASSRSMSNPAGAVGKQNDLAAMPEI